MTDILPPFLSSQHESYLISSAYPWSPFLSDDDSSSSLGMTADGDSPQHFRNPFIYPPLERRGPLRVRNENEAPDPPAHTNVDALEAFTIKPSPRQASSQHSRKTSWGTDIPPPSRAWDLDTVHRESDLLEEVNLDASSQETCGGDGDTAATDGNQGTIRIVTNAAATKASTSPTTEHDQPGPVQESFSPTPEQRDAPFRKWVNSLRRRSLTHRRAVIASTRREPIEEDDRATARSSEAGKSRHKQSSSLSSMAFVTAIKTASISLASGTMPAKSRKPGPSSFLRSGRRSIRSSNPDARYSVDSTGYTAFQGIDEEVRKRAVQRRRILEELVSSEESYIGDMKILVNVYFMLLASVKTLSQYTRTSIQRNVSEILQLHEELLGELHRVIPNSEYAQDHSSRTVSAESRGHIRWRSLDAVPEDTLGLRESKSRMSIDTARSTGPMDLEMMAEAKVAADVAHVFQQFMKRFFAYEEYGAKYDLMIHDVASTYKAIPLWHAYEKGIEALASSITSINSRAAQERKGLTFGDLLIKPIQRVCKYPLLFADLVKQTPVCDCPESHAELEKVLYRLRETTRQINKATDDPYTREKIEKTWHLQDRLLFPEQTYASQAITLRLLGHVILCGVLHVAWQTNSGVQGDFMLCALFRSYLILATLNKANGTYLVVGCVNLDNMKLERADNGRGLQCHTALYTWKIVFETGNRLFEMMLSACSATEEEVWKHCLVEETISETTDEYGGESASQDFLPFLCLDMKAIGNVFGQRGSLARRLSIHRATTVGPRTSLCHVIIKNTHNLIEGQDSSTFSSASIIRSQSLLSTNRVPVLAPKRTDRMRMEAGLNDVWTRDRLPYPGMGTRRPDHAIKVSASSMIRKLSMASITSNFSKRSASYVSLSAMRKVHEEGNLSEKLAGGGDVDVRTEATVFVSSGSTRSKAGSHGHGPHDASITSKEGPSSIFRRARTIRVAPTVGKAENLRRPSVLTKKGEMVAEGKEGIPTEGPSTLGKRQSMHTFARWFGY